VSQTVNVHEAKTNLSRLLERVRRGEEVIIAKAGKPVAKLVPVPEAGRRVLGTARGQIAVGDDFDDPLPPDVLEGFYR
jgi:prevent-host-death family protein